MNRKIFIWAYVCISIISSFETLAQFKSNTVTIGAGGFVSGIISDTKTGDIYCRTDVGGAYRWDAASNRWVQLIDWISDSQGGLSGVESLAIDPQNPNNIYMLCGISYLSSGLTAILKSTDKGTTFSVIDVTSKFKAHGNGYGRGNGERLMVDPNNSDVIFCGTRYDGLWKSTDAGNTWTQAWSGVTTTPNSNGICFVLFDPASASGGVTKTIYIGVSRTGSANIYKSIDGGVTFSDISADIQYMPHRATLNGTTMYVTLADSEGPGTSGAGKLYKLNTTTNVWTDITPLSNNFSYGGVGVDPGNVNRVVVSTTGIYQNNMYGTSWGDFIYFSTDGGTSWTLKNGSNSKYDNNGIGWFSGQAHWVECIEFDPMDSKKVRSVGGAGILTCEDIEAAVPVWKFDVKGIEETALLDAISIPGGPLVSALGDVEGFVHNDINAYPVKTHQPSVGTNRSIAYAGKNTKKLVRATNEGTHVYYSADQGTTWTGCATNKGSGGRVAISADGGTILHCPDNSSTTYYSTDNGSNWIGAGGSTLTSAIPVGDLVNSNYFYIFNSSNGQMLTSSNKGVSFSVTGNAGATSTPWTSTFIRTVPGNEGHLWVPLVDNGLKYSTDHGATYTTVANVTYCKAVGIGKAISSTSYPAIYIWGTVKSVRGLFRSVDKGATWIKMNDDAHQFGGAELMLGDPNIFGRVYTGNTSARGIVYWDDLTKYTLTTTAEPVAGGTISGTGTYTIGSTVTVTATPASGYIFTGWSGDASGTNASVVVTMNSDKNVTANFQLQSNTTKYTLTTTASPSDGGSISGEGTYDAGSTPTLTATPAAGYIFTGWSGDASGTDASVTVTMNSNKTIIANFSVITFTLSATVVPSTGGSVTGPGVYPSSTVVIIEAVPVPGYTFVGWNGDIAGIATSQTITMTSNVAVQANFQSVEDVVLKIPKLFSPDNRGDVSTEAWNIENAHLLDGCEIVIYNRAGQKVYSSTGYPYPWDGTSNGRPLPDGAYFYLIRYPDNTKQTGSVTIARLK